MIPPPNYTERTQPEDAPADEHTSPTEHRAWRRPARPAVVAVDSGDLADALAVTDAERARYGFGRVGS